MGSVHRLGAGTLAVAHAIGGMTVLLFQLTWNTLLFRMDPLELWRNLYKVGVKSFPIVVVTALLVGAIMVVQTGQLVSQYDAFGLLGWGAAFATFREIGPVMIGLMLSGRVGANNTAELGTMVVTEQVDALRALAIPPLTYLLTPRYLAIVVMTLLLTVVGDLTAIVGGALTAKFMLGVEPTLFFWSVDEYIKVADFLNGLVKAFFFGMAIAVVSCHFGVTTTGGAVGVGRSVNNSVVASAVSIFVLDYVVTYVLK
jgi:phospholipid/cholesterol/gamma-HCH transport system permease protein